ncbi:MAG TPA: N-acetylmuramoyl-L-alanine amidase [Rhodothermales bacterium]|nr:N-acetylmuramoyl-L-alanine amidase [Rhodothermales bacterium]
MRGQAVGDYSDRPVQLSARDFGTVGKAHVQIFTAPEVEGEFNGVVIRAKTEALDPVVWIRFPTSPGGGEWHEMILLPGPSSPFLMAAYNGELVVTLGGFEIAVSPFDAEFEIVAAGVFDTRVDEDATVGPWSGALYSKSTSAGKIIPPRLHTRKEWGAEPFIGTPVALARPTHDFMTFHHAACCGAHSLAEGLAQLKAIQDFHQDGRGWSDIGYHFVLDQSGRVYQGRPFLDESIKFENGPPLAMGAHAGGANTGNIGVSLLGCYHPSEGAGCRDVLSPAAEDSLVTLFAFLSETYGVSPALLRGHRDFSSTACPGDNNYQLIPQLRQRIANLLEMGNRPVGIASLIAVVNEDGVVSIDWQFIADLGITEFRVDRVSASGRETLFSSDQVMDMSITDDEVASPGEVRYELLASNADGRVQQLASARVDIEHPLDFVLSSSFPNPFSQASTIRYFLAQDGFVTLRVFDAAGRLVDELQDGFQEKDRWYTGHFDAGDLSSGTYFYRITVDGFAGVVFDESGTLILAR